MAAQPKVLLALADPNLGIAMAKHLGARGFEPVIAKGSAGALEVFREVSPDAVVASQLLSGVDGVGLCKKVKELKAVPVLIIAAVSSPGAISDVRRISNAEEVLPATFQPENLIAALRKMTSPPAPRKTKEAAKEEKEKSGEFRAAAKAAAAAAPQVAAQAIEASFRQAPRIEAPPAPVQPAAFAPAVAVSPPVPIEPAFILSRAYLDRVTGALRFVSGAVERIVYLAQGRPIVATSNVEEERIGQILVRKGKLTPKELETALAQVHKKGKRLGEVVVEMGVMTRREHDEDLADQYAERILGIFAWNEASVEFQPRPAPDELVAIRLPPERLVVEGLRRHYDVARLERVLTDPYRVLRPSGEALQKLPYLNLSPMESAALVLVDGAKSVADVAGLAPARLEALRALYACVCLGLMA